MKRYIKSAYNKQFPEYSRALTPTESHLNDLANSYYDADDWDVFNEFTDDELVTLWDIATSLGAAYDDEVYEAINNRPNASELFAKAERYSPDFADVCVNRVLTYFFRGKIAADEAVNRISEILHTTDL